MSSGWLNNVQTYIAGYQDVAALAGLGIYSARGAVQDIQQQVEAAIAKLNSYLQITSTADDAGAEEGDSSTTDSATEKAASTKAAREATVEKVHTAFSNLTADKKKSVKELCQTIETTLRALHNQYQRLLNGNRIIALKAELILPNYNEEGNMFSSTTRSKQKYLNETQRLGSTETTTARTEFKAAKTKLYDLLAMIQAVRSGSFTPDDKKAIVERPKTLANLFFIMDQKDADEELELQETAALDAATEGLADTTIKRHELEKQGGARAIRDTEQDIRQRELSQQQRIREQKLVATKQQLGDITALVKETQDVIDQAASAGAPAEVRNALEGISWRGTPQDVTDPEALHKAAQTAASFAEAVEKLDTAAAKPNATSAKRKMLEGLRNKFTRLGEQWSAWRYSRIQPKAKGGVDWVVNSAAEGFGDERDDDQSSATRPGSRAEAPEPEIEMTSPSGRADRPLLSRQQSSRDLLSNGAAEGDSSGPAATRHPEVEGYGYEEGYYTETEQYDRSTGKKKRELLEGSLRASGQTRTADELEAAAPARAEAIATALIAQPDLNKDGRTDAQEKDVADKATGFLASIKALGKRITGRAKKPAADQGLITYQQYLLSPSVTLESSREKIEEVLIVPEITELWTLGSSIIVKVKDNNTYYRVTISNEVIPDRMILRWRGSPQDIVEKKDLREYKQVTIAAQGETRRAAYKKDTDTQRAPASQDKSSATTRPGSRPARPQRVTGDATEGIEMTSASSRDLLGNGAAKGTVNEEEGFAASGPAASAHPLPAEVKKEISRWQRLLRSLGLGTTADQLDAATPPQVEIITTKAIENPDADGDGTIDDTEKESAEAAKGILASIKALGKRITGRAKKPVDQGATTETGGDDSGSTREPVSVDPTDDPSILIVRDPVGPQTEKEEGIYRLTKPLTIQLKRTTKSLATFRIMDGLNNEITNIEKIWLTESGASLTVYTQLRSDPEEYAQISRGYSTTSVAKDNIYQDGELVIIVSSRVLKKYDVINDENLVYPTIGSYWQNTAPVKPIAERINQPTAERNVSDDEDSESRERSSSLGRQITETTADPFASQ